MGGTEGTAQPHRGLGLEALQLTLRPCHVSLYFNFRLSNLGKTTLVSMARQLEIY